MGARRLWSQRPSQVAEGKIKTKKGIRVAERRRQHDAAAPARHTRHPGTLSLQHSRCLMEEVGRAPSKPQPQPPLHARQLLVCRQMASHSAPCASTTALHSSTRHPRLVEAKMPPAVNKSQPLGHAAPARPVPQRLRHDHLLSSATQSVGRERLRGRAAS